MKYCLSECINNIIVERGGEAFDYGYHQGDQGDRKSG